MYVIAKRHGRQNSRACAPQPQTYKQKHIGHSARTGHSGNQIDSMKNIAHGYFPDCKRNPVIQGMRQSQAEETVNITVKDAVLNQTTVLPEQSRRTTDPIDYRKHCEYKTIALRMRQFREVLRNQFCVSLTQ
jgi:hypothetical protein